MKPFDRNASILEHIISYCDQIQQTVERFGDDYALFESDPIYRNATALCILQIGELVGMLTDDFCTLAADQGYAEYRCPQLRLCCSRNHLGDYHGRYPGFESVLSGHTRK